MIDPVRLIDISLTGEKSHQANIHPGQGSFTMGTKGMSKGSWKYDVWVEEGEPICWDAFNEFYMNCRFMQPDTENYPYGDWPCDFYYSGNDKGFAEWSFRRKIYGFYWIPQEDTTLDLMKANIKSFSLETIANKIELSVGDHLRRLCLYGNLEHITITKCAGIPVLWLSPIFRQTGAIPYRLPVFKALAKTRNIRIMGTPLGQPFDCRSLLQFPELTHLQMEGNLVHLEALTALKYLEYLGMWYVSDLTGMPKLSDWKKLRDFRCIDCEETTGRKLRAELKNLSQEREMDESCSICRLRKKTWFVTEYGIPFSNWENRIAKAATKAYKSCLHTIKQAQEEGEVREAIYAFVEVINQLPDIETAECEDTAVAVDQLVASSGLGISRETGREWFEEVRDF